MKRGAEHGRFRTGKTVRGYARSRGADGMRLEHRRIAERAVGRTLAPRHPIHHHGDDRDGNTGLVVCESVAYHNLLHQRERAMAACGNPDWRKCRHCQQYDAPSNLRFYGSGQSPEHPRCPARARR